MLLCQSEIGERQNISEFLQFGRIFDQDGRGVEPEPNNTGRPDEC